MASSAYAHKGHTATVAAAIIARAVRCRRFPYARLRGEKCSRTHGRVLLVENENAPVPSLYVVHSSLLLLLLSLYAAQK